MGLAALERVPEAARDYLRQPGCVRDAQDSTAVPFPFLDQLMGFVDPFGPFTVTGFRRPAHTHSVVCCHVPRGCRMARNRGATWPATVGAQLTPAAWRPARRGVAKDHSTQPCWREVDHLCARAGVELARTGSPGEKRMVRSLVDSSRAIALFF